jgi:hypothetical protein
LAGREEFSAPAFGVVVSVDPHGVVVVHPGDELFVLDADDACELGDVANKGCWESDELECLANVGAQ